MLEDNIVQGKSGSEPSRLISGLKSEVSVFRTTALGFSSLTSLLVVGQESMIGSALARTAESSGIPFIGTSRRPGARWPLDLAATPESWQLPKNASTAILCAAETSVDKCAKNPATTRKINTTSVIELADRLAALGTHIVFLSSRQVFSPCIEFPDESTVPQPVSEYGRQKLDVEEHLLRRHPSAKVIRFAKIVSPALPLLSAWRQAMANGASVQAYADLFLSAVSLCAAADAIMRIALGSVPGIFHVSASDAISYFDLARFLASLEGVDPSLVQPLPSPQPNTHGSAILSCPRTMETTTFRSSTSLENIRSAFNGITI